MKPIPMIGRRFGELTVYAKGEKRAGHQLWQCKCDCENESLVFGENLRSGHTTSCGRCERYNLLDGGVIECVLKTGDSFLFDACYFPLVSAHKWSIENSGYVHTTIDGKHIRLHRMLCPEYLMVDHINGNRADNRMSNLREATNKENCRNAKKPITNTTGFKGVSYSRQRNRYSSYITVDGKNLFLGYYTNPIEAAIAYDKAAAFYFGEFARPNFKEELKDGQILEVRSEQVA